MYKKNNLYRNLEVKNDVFILNMKQILQIYLMENIKIAKKSDIINLNRLGILEIIILIMLINLDISL